MSEVVAILELESELSQSTTELESAFNENLEIIDCEFADGINLGGTRDYRKLINKPSINNTELYDNYDEIDPTVPNWAKDDKPKELPFAEIKSVWDTIFG